MADSKNNKKTLKKTDRRSIILYNNLVRLIANDDVSSSTKAFNIIRDMTGEDMSGMWDAEFQAFIDTRNLKGLFFSEDWPFIVMDLIACKIASQPLVIKRDEKLDDGKVESKIIADHPYQETIDDPNEMQDYYSWMYCLVVDLISTGNAIIWKGLNDGENLWQIPADEIAMDFSKEKALVSYRRILANNEGGVQTVSEFPKEQIIHIRRPNPNSYFWGLSPWIPGRKSVLFSRYSSEYLNNYYIKGTTPGLCLEMQQGANEKAAIRMLRSFEQAYSGRKNQRRTMVLPMGVTAKNIAASLADQQLKDYVDSNRETIIAILKVPKHELGLQTAGSLGSEEYKTALLNFWSATLKPTMSMITGALNKSLEKQLGKGNYLDFDLSNVEILKDDMIKKSSLGQSMLATHTLNEVRQEVFSKPPVDGGDTVQSLRQQTVTNPFNFLGAQATETKAASDDVDIQLIGENSAETMIKAHKNWFDARQDKIVKETEPAIEDLTELSIDMFAAQGEAIISALSKVIKEKAIEKPSDEKLKGIIENALASYEQKWIDKYMNILTTKMDFGYNLAIDAPFKMPNEDEIIAIGENTRSKRNEILRARGIENFQRVNATTTNEIMNIIADSIKKQDNLDQLIGKIAEKYSGDVDNILYRAERIARTETLTAVSMGQGAAMKNAKKIMPTLQKMWISAKDDRVRGNPGGQYPNSSSDHWDLHGQIVDSEENFVDPKSGESLMFPRDPSASKGAIINCRCTFVMMPKSDMDKFKKDPQAKPN